MAKPAQNNQLGGVLSGPKPGIGYPGQERNGGGYLGPPTKEQPKMITEPRNEFGGGLQQRDGRGGGNPFGERQGFGGGMLDAARPRGQMNRIPAGK